MAEQYKSIYGAAQEVAKENLDYEKHVFDLESQKEDLEAKELENQMKDMRFKQLQKAEEKAQRMAPYEYMKEAYDMYAKFGDKMAAPLFEYAAIAHGARLDRTPYMTKPAQVGGRLGYHWTDLDGELVKDMRDNEPIFMPQSLPAQDEPVKPFEVKNPDGTSSYFTAVRDPNTGTWVWKPFETGKSQAAVAAGKGAPQPGSPISPPPGYPKPDKGEHYVTGPDGQPMLKAIPGGEKWKEEEDKKRAAAEKAKKARLDAIVVTRAIDQILHLDAESILPATGPLSLFTQYNPMGNAWSIPALAKAIKAKVGFGALQDMRNASPTGGALGQVSNAENELLQAALGSLDTVGQDTELLRSTLNQIRQLYLNAYFGTDAERAAAVKRGDLTPEQAAEMARKKAAFGYDKFGNPLPGSPGFGGEIAPAQAPGELSVDQQAARTREALGAGPAGEQTDSPPASMLQEGVLTKMTNGTFWIKFNGQVLQIQEGRPTEFSDGRAYTLEGGKPKQIRERAK